MCVCVYTPGFYGGARSCKIYEADRFFKVFPTFLLLMEIVTRVLYNKIMDYFVITAIWS